MSGLILSYLHLDKQLILDTDVHKYLKMKRLLQLILPRVFKKLLCHRRVLFVI